MIRDQVVIAVMEGRLSLVEADPVGKRELVKGVYPVAEEERVNKTNVLDESDHSSCNYIILSVGLYFTILTFAITEVYIIVHKIHIYILIIVSEDKSSQLVSKPLECWVNFPPVLSQ